VKSASISAAFLLSLTCAPAPAAAHHSYAAFDACKLVTLEGEIASVEWVNPHVRIQLRTADAGAYFVEWFSLLQLQRAGIETDALQPGDWIRVSGSAMRDPNRKVRSLLTEIRRHADGWAWETARQVPAACNSGG
jgi:hypothetical protein